MLLDSVSCKKAVQHVDSRSLDYILTLSDGEMALSATEPQLLHNKTNWVKSNRISSLSFAIALIDRTGSGAWSLLHTKNCYRMQTFISRSLHLLTSPFRLSHLTNLRSSCFSPFHIQVLYPSLGTFYNSCSLHLTLSSLFALKLNKKKVESEFRVHCRWILAYQMTQPHFNEAAFPLELLSLDWCQITWGALLWLSPITAFGCSWGKWPYYQELHRCHLCLNELISGVGGCVPK